MPFSLSRRTLLGSAASTLSFLALHGGFASAQDTQDRIDGVAREIEPLAEPLPEIADPGFARFIDRYADAKVILLGEASHGTDEFYRARTAITERLVREHGFTVVAALLHNSG